MQLGTFQENQRTFIGVLLGEEVLDLAGTAAVTPGIAEAAIFSDLRTVLPQIERVREMLALYQSGGGVRRCLSAVKVLAPITNPNKIICVGLNYRDHAVESGETIPTEPVIFTKFRTAINRPGGPIVLPRLSKQVDYEAELGVIIGKKGRDIPEKAALDYVGGYTATNDVSARDLQLRSSQWTNGKAIDTFFPMGPYLVTPDEIGDPQQLDIQLKLNGRIMQSSNTREFIFKISQLISFLSQLFTLEPGDVISTGTPSGVGFVRKPPVFLKAGDEVSVIIEKIGELTNSVVD
jgi:2-keto-4-pentenoate hydratase/2-oxohepta-3-ene-1,7-dioic acid hydratase in catechol pathway